MLTHRDSPILIYRLCALIRRRTVWLVAWCPSSSRLQSTASVERLCPSISRLPSPTNRWRSLACSFNSRPTYRSPVSKQMFEHRPEQKTNSDNRQTKSNRMNRIVSLFSSGSGSHTFLTEENDLARVFIERLGFWAPISFQIKRNFSSFGELSHHFVFCFSSWQKCYLLLRLWKCKPNRNQIVLKIKPNSNWTRTVRKTNSNDFLKLLTSNPGFA